MPYFFVNKVIPVPNQNKKKTLQEKGIKGLVSENLQQFRESCL